MSPHSRSGRRARLAAVIVVAVALAPAMTACSALTGSSSSTTAPATAPAGASGAATTPAASATPGTSSTEPTIVVATTSGAIERLNPATGAVGQTLVPAGTGVLGDELSVSDSGTVYYAVGSGACDSTIYSIPDGGGGGTPTPIASGTLPTISPDGTKLAYAVEPRAAQDCSGWDTSTPGTAFKVDIRTISSGTTVSIPELPATQQGLPAPITHLSWASDNDHLAVSIEPVQDNEGWALNTLDTSNAQTYLGANVTTVPVTGASPHGQSFLSEGVYLPDGNLFVVHSCCAGIEGKTDAPLLWEVLPDGALLRQVAIGFANTVHDSLDVSADGNWLLYLGGGDLYVSQGGARPSQITTGLAAAAWA
ncbi:MAG TPA: hypothetical protein VI365_32310 [Trebonia sp.]